MKIKITYLFYLISVFLTVCSNSNALELTDVVQFTVENVDRQKGILSLKLTTKDDFKIYQENLEFDLVVPGSLPFNLSYEPFPEADLVYDPFANTDKYIFKNGTTFLLSIDSGVELQGDEKILISVQACSTGVCLLPATIQFAVQNGATSGYAAQVSAFSQMSAKQLEKKVSSVQSPDSIKKSTQAVIKQESVLSSMLVGFLQNGSILLFPLLFLAGLITNLTPCVYPMIPITIGVMHQFGKHKSKIKLSLIYVLGMVITYSALGVLAAMTGQVFGSQFSSPIFSVMIAIIMLLLGLAMIDFFDLSFLQRLSYRIPFAEKNPFLAVGTMGAVSGLVAAPCTGPILSMILVLIAQTRAPITGFIYMLCFAIGFGAPYVILAFASQKLTKLPKMHRTSAAIKLIFASLMFGLAFYFLKPILAQYTIFEVFYAKPRFTTFSIVFACLAIFLILQQINLKIVAHTMQIMVVLNLSVLCLWLTLWLSNAFILVYPKSSGFENMLQSSRIHWEQNFSKAVQHAKAQNKKIIIDVWAEWCTACLEMEHTTWNDENISKLINTKFIPVKMDYTHPTKEVSERLNQWKIVGLPAVIIVDPTILHEPLELYQGTISKENLLKKLSSY